MRIRKKERKKERRKKRKKEREGKKKKEKEKKKSLLSVTSEWNRGRIKLQNKLVNKSLENKINPPCEALKI